MNVGSLFSGIGGFDLGLERAGMRVVWQCESDPYRRRVLRRHWPGVPCCEDVRDVGDSDAARGGERHWDQSRRDDGAERLGSRRSSHDPIDLLCGGFPCQDLSVAGRRAGLAGERSGLFYEFMRVAGELVRPGGYVLIENVPGLLSSNGGRDFAIVLASLADLGFHDLAYRVLDSRYFGVPQRRRRVYVLGRRAGGRVCSEVLLEPESGGGDFTKGREAGQGVAATFGVGVAGTIGNATQAQRNGGQRTTDLDNHGAYVAGTVRSHARPGSNEVGSIVSTPPDPDGVRASPGVSGRVDGRAFQQNSRSELRFIGGEGDEVGAVAAEPGVQQQNYILGGGGMNGSPHDPKPDGPRYAACGDAVTVNVSEWIGRRLLDFEREQVAA